jgi:UDP-N-acetylmuramyl pentapeptide phosphotransferase/UDP-N-acetylglucosamine-1-phosphate transferase
MEIVVSAGAGAVVAALLWLAMRPTFAAPLFARTNHRGASVPVAAGIITVLAVLFLSAVEHLLIGLRIDQDVLHAGDFGALEIALGFGLLGFIDDVAEVGAAKGFRGHLGALRRGQVTTGALKLIGGLAVAVWVIAVLDVDRPVDLLVDTLLIAGAANVGNLFDRAPGRTIKVSVVLGGILLACTWGEAPPGVAVMLGAALGLLLFDLREELMLGDAGANPLGAMIGFGVVLASPFAIRVAALGFVVVLNIASEIVSFSSVIDRNPLLRGLDRLGRKA